MYLVVRLASLIHLAAAAECFSLAEAKGVSTKLVYELISGAAGSSEQFNQEFPRMQNNHFIRGPEAKSVSFKSVFDDMVRASPTMATASPFLRSPCERIEH